ncbi:MAG: pilus assembly PilX N-terminal domain-containing protein [Elusimicrobiota bacterium]|nr:pilus assembly PilX N-terminal domain-containing protein [Elusimicrobiota bacterium]
MKLNKNNNKGMALVAAILIMVVLALLGMAMVVLTSSETRKEVKSRLGTSALYIADAGIEKAIHRIKEGETGSFSFTVVVGTATGAAEGEADVTVNPQGGSQYEILSTGHVPSIADSRFDRTIRAVVEVEPEQPEEAMRSVGPITVASNVNVYGTLRSNSQISFAGGNHIYEDSNGNCDIMTSTGMGSGVYIPSSKKVYWEDGGTYYVKSNGPTNDEIGSDQDTTGVFDESSMIKNNGSIVKIVEGAGTVEEITPAEVPFYDSDAIESAAENSGVEYGTHQTYDNTSQLDLAGQTHWFKDGVTINSNGFVETSSGTIYVTGGAGDTPLEWNDSVGSNFVDDFVKVNLIIDDQAGADKSIDFKSGIWTQGYVYCPGDLTLPSNVHVSGVIEVGTDSDVSSNVEIRYDEIGYEIPGGGSGGVTIISWEEL